MKQNCFIHLYSPCWCRPWVYVWKQTCDWSSASFWGPASWQWWYVSVLYQDLNTRKLCKCSHGTSPQFWIRTHRPVLIYVHQNSLRHEGTSARKALETSCSSNFCVGSWEGFTALKHCQYSCVSSWPKACCLSSIGALATAALSRLGFTSLFSCLISTPLLVNGMYQ